MRAEPDDRYEPSGEHETGRSRRGVLSILVAGVAVIAFGAAVWYAYTLGARSGSPADVPVIAANPSPWKKRPEDPGGLKVANQDKAVFDRLEPELAEPKEERLLPPPEEPMEPPPPIPTGGSMQADATSPLAQDGETPPQDGAAPAAEEAVARDDAGAEPATERQPTTDTPAAGAASAETAANETSAAEAAPAEPSREVASLPPAGRAPASGGYRIQLAALRSEPDARREWQRIQSANSDLLGNLSMNVERADLGDRGVFYRLQAGPLEDKTLADLLCSKLKGRNLACLVVAR